MPGETSLQFSLSQRQYSTVARRCLLCEKVFLWSQIVSRLLEAVRKMGVGFRRVCGQISFFRGVFFNGLLLQLPQIGFFSRALVWPTSTMVLFIFVRWQPWHKWQTSSDKFDHRLSDSIAFSKANCWVLDISSYCSRGIAHRGSCFPECLRCLVFCLVRFTAIWCIVKSSCNCLYIRGFGKGHCSAANETPVLRHSHFSLVKVFKKSGVFSYL